MDVDRVQEAADQLASEIGRLLAAVPSAVSLSGPVTLGGTQAAGKNAGEDSIEGPTNSSASARTVNSAASFLPFVSRVIQPIIQAPAPQAGPMNWLRWLNPFASLLGLFGGPDEEETVAPTTLKAPAVAPLKYLRGIRAENDWRSEEVDFAADGRVRSVNPAAPPTVVVQVQAIDSRSFLEHSDAIADAVKKSLLESHTLAETVREL